MHVGSPGGGGGGGRLENSCTKWTRRLNTHDPCTSIEHDRKYKLEGHHFSYVGIVLSVVILQCVCVCECVHIICVSVCGGGGGGGGATPPMSVLNLSYM